MILFLGLAHLWNIPEDVPHAVCEETVTSNFDLRHQKMEMMIFSPGNGM